MKKKPIIVEPVKRPAPAKLRPKAHFVPKPKPKPVPTPVIEEKEPEVVIIPEPIIHVEEAPISVNETDNVVIESIDFISKDEKNKLSIKYSKKSNRSFRIQIFLNDEQELRPVTYTGSSTGNTFWSLLKGALKK